jgi:hypothetical protein
MLVRVQCAGACSCPESNTDEGTGAISSLARRNGGTAPLNAGTPACLRVRQAALHPGAQPDDSDVCLTVKVEVSAYGRVV